MGVSAKMASLRFNVNNVFFAEVYFYYLIFSIITSKLPKYKLLKLKRIEAVFTQ